MQKRGMSRIDKHSAIFLIGVIIIIAGTLFLLPKQSTNITGLTVAEVNEETLFSEVQRLLQEFPLTRHAGSGAEMCLLIDLGDNNVKSFDLFKSQQRLSVSESKFSRYCSNDITNGGSEDLVIKYTSYEAFRRHLEDPSCDRMKKLLASQELLYLPSEFIQPGGQPICNGLFQDRYCNAINRCLGFHELPAFGLDCCIQQPPQPAMPGWGTKAFIAMIFILLILVILSIVVAVHIKHKHEEQAQQETEEYQTQIEQFLEQGLANGYTKSELKQELMNDGWDEEFIDPIIRGFR